MNYEELFDGKGKPIKMWTKGVPVEEEAKEQLLKTAQLPIIFKHLAVMPDVHLGKGSTIGSVIPTISAIIPAAVGVDIGCGMIAAKTSLVASDLPDSLLSLRFEIEKAVPHGVNYSLGLKNDSGSWQSLPLIVQEYWKKLLPGFEKIISKYPHLKETNNYSHLGTLGGGNHFIELCLDENQNVWIMLHSGSRGIGNAIGKFFIELAKSDMETHIKNLPDENLAYLKEGTEHFNDYVNAVHWAQEFARLNREVMMLNTIEAIRKVILQEFTVNMDSAINCHHNYVKKEYHFEKEVFITRKGAISALAGELGIIPSSMGTKSYIVQGLGNIDSFNSCSHGAGRVMSRNKAKKLFTIEDQIKATKHVECRKDKNVIDEIPFAYKNIDSVMAAQKDLVKPIHELTQILCVKG